ncbi:uncharacterized protein LOC143151996 isoform X2 [Ptiloglossa arizonensis]|uniref:uncharacterized protein LOC143151996 isoform X2 n=1 Tax=Ptiloglossa arizonensis TaxID=3350558 RepID=UPI003F9FDFFB
MYNIRKLFIELLHKTWTIFGVSTLFNFHQDEVHLKRYAKRLREEVAMSLSQEDVMYNAKLYIMTYVEIRPSPIDPPPIKIEVYAKKYHSNESVEKCIYKGILLSWKTIDKELAMSNCMRLPLLLCHGTKSTMKIVHKTLGHMFDCIIIALNALEEDLVWLIPIVVSPTNEEEHPKRTDTISMEYKLTTSLDTDIIIIHFKISDLIRIVKMYAKDQNDEENVEISFDSNYVDKCREALHTQVLHTAGLQMGQCMLYKINLPTFTIMANKMKIRNMNVMNRVLLYLNKKALGICHTYNFEMF